MMPISLHCTREGPSGWQTSKAVNVCRKPLLPLLPQSSSCWYDFRVTDLALQADPHPPSPFLKVLRAFSFQPLNPQILMSPQAGFLLQTEVLPRLISAIPQAVSFIGSEDAQELIQDGTLIAAQMIHNAERAGKEGRPKSWCWSSRCQEDQDHQRRKRGLLHDPEVEVRQKVHRFKHGRCLWLRYADQRHHQIDFPG